MDLLQTLPLRTDHAESVATAIKAKMATAARLLKEVAELREEAAGLVWGVPVDARMRLLQAMVRPKRPTMAEMQLSLDECVAEQFQDNWAVASKGMTDVELFHALFVQRDPVTIRHTH